MKIIQCELFMTVCRLFSTSMKLSALRGVVPCYQNYPDSQRIMRSGLFIRLFVLRITVLDGLG